MRLNDFFITMRVHWSASELGLDTRQSAPESALETTAGLHRFAQELGLDPRQSAPESVLESTAGLHTSRCVCAQLCLTLCGPMDCSPPGSSVHGISQARILEWIAIFFFRKSSQPGDQALVSCNAGRFFTTSAT